MLILAMGSLVVFLLMVHLIVGRTCREDRSVLLQMPLEQAWESLRDFGGLHLEHGRGRPLVAIDSSTIVRGDGLEPGSIWRQQGRWDGGRFWCEIEIIESEAPRRLVVSLHRDSFGTERGLMRHRLVLELDPYDQRSTRLRLRMTARLNNLRLVLGRTLSPERMHARLLDLGLRSIKQAIEGTGAAAPATVAPFPASASLGMPIGDGASLLPGEGVLPTWIKPEVAAAALYSLRPIQGGAWAASAEGALDQP